MVIILSFLYYFKVLLHTALEYIRVQKEDETFAIRSINIDEKLNMTKKKMVNNFLEGKKNTNNTEKLLNQFGAFGVPVIFLIFLIVYSITGFAIQYNG